MFILGKAKGKWRVKPIRHYDLMEELWAADRATGQGVGTARQVRRRIESQSFNVNLNEEHMEYCQSHPHFSRRLKKLFHHHHWWILTVQLPLIQHHVHLLPETHHLGDKKEKPPWWT